MKATAAIGFSICLVILATGCAGKKVALERGWVGGDFLVAKRPSWNVPADDPKIVPALPKELASTQKSAIFVSQVYSNTPLAVAGFHAGDLILGIDHRQVEKLPSFHKIIDHHRPGSTVSVSVFRNGKIEDRPVTIGRETYKSWKSFTIGFGISGTLQVDLIPNPDFSLIVLGYYKNPHRVELHSPRSEFISSIKRKEDQKKSDEAGTFTSQKWESWLAIFSVGGYKSVLSQEIVEPEQAASVRP